VKDAKSFFQGYIDNIKKNPERYSEVARTNPESYAKNDVHYALGYFTTARYYKLWNNVLSKKS